MKKLIIGVLAALALTGANALENTVAPKVTQLKTPPPKPDFMLVIHLLTTTAGSMDTSGGLRRKTIEIGQPE